MSRHNGSHSISLEGGIGLIDILKIILKYKLAVLLTVIVVNVLVAIYVFTVTPMYESKAVLRIGNIGNVENVNKSIQIEDSQELVRRLKEEYMLDDGSEQGAYLAEASFNRKGAKNIIEIKALGESAVGAQQFLNKLVDKVFAEHTALFKTAIEENHKSLKALSEHRDKYVDLISELDKKITSLDNDPAHASILVLEKGEYLAVIPEFEMQILKLQLQQSDLYTKPTLILRSPTLATYHSKPKTKILLAIGFVLSVLMGLIAAFILMAMSIIRKKISE